MPTDKDSTDMGKTQMGGIHSRDTHSVSERHTEGQKDIGSESKAELCREKK